MWSSQCSIADYKERENGDLDMPTSIADEHNMVYGHFDNTYPAVRLSVEQNSCTLGLSVIDVASVKSMQGTNIECLSKRVLPS